MTIQKMLRGQHREGYAQMLNGAPDAESVNPSGDGCDAATAKISGPTTTSKNTPEAVTERMGIIGWTRRPAPCRTAKHLVRGIDGPRIASTNMAELAAKQIRPECEPGPRDIASQR